MESFAKVMRSFGAELLSSFIFFFVVCGTSVELQVGAHQHWVLIKALVTTLTAIAVIYTFGYDRGAHFNPAVTVAAVVSKKIDLIQGVVFVILQVTAATLATILLAILYPGTANVASSLILQPSSSSFGQAIAYEFILTFIFVYVVCGVYWGVSARTEPEDASNQPEEIGRAEDAKRRLNFAPIAIGCALGALSCLAESVSGGAFNPARVTGPAIAALQYNSLHMYWIGDLAGAVAAALLYRLLHREAEGTANRK